MSKLLNETVKYFFDKCYFIYGNKSPYPNSFNEEWLKSYKNFVEFWAIKLKECDLDNLDRFIGTFENREKFSKKAPTFLEVKKQKYIDNDEIYNTCHYY